MSRVSFLNVLPVLWCALWSIPSALGSGLCSSYEARCPLQLGVPLEQEFTSRNGQSLYFQVTLPESSSNIRVSVSLNYGDIDIYAAKGREPSPSSYDFMSMESRDLVVLEGSYSKDDAIIILVRATHISSVLSVVAAAGSSVVPLILGLPSRDEISAGETKREFSFTPTFSGTYTVSLTPYTRGDPNLVVRRPDGGETWTSHFDGADFISITPRFEDLNHAFKIEVTSDNSVTFSVTANVDGASTSPGVLLGGFPQYDYLNQGTEKYYTLLVPKGSADVVIIVDSIYGDADLFVNPSNKGFYTTADKAEAPATWKSEHTFGSETVFIGSDDDDMMRNGGEYMITVTGFGAASINLRGYSAQTAIAVIEGQPVRDEISGRTFHYYKFYDNHPKEQLIVNVNPVFGDPDIYIGCKLSITGNSSGYPSNAYKHYNHSSMRIGEDSIVITPSSPHKCNRGVYYMAVYGYSNSEFIVTVTHEGGAVLLSDGVQVEGTVYANTGRNYRFRMGPEAEQLSVRLTSFTGDADLYVKMNGEDASMTNYDYRSGALATVDDVDAITIPEDKVCADCFISIYVHSYKTSRYSLVALLEDTTIQLVDSVPFMESAAYNMIQYYTLTPISAGNVSVVVTVFSGAPVLYVSNSEEQPSETSPNTLIDREAEFGNVPVLTVHVALDHGSHSPKPIFIGVGGAGTNCSYTVRAALQTMDQNTGSARPPLLRLIQGTPQRETMKYNDGTNQWRYYQVLANEGHQSINVRATSLIGNIDLYVKQCPYSNFQCAGNYTVHDNGIQVSYLPTLTDYSSTTAGQPDDMLMIQRDDLSHCSYIIGVYSSSMFVEYQISFAMEDSILRLQPGVSVSDAVEQKTYSYFSFAMPPGRKAVRFILTPKTGDPDLFISVKTKHPTSSNNTWHSTMYGGDTLTIAPIEDEQACTDCMYYIAVYGYQEASFSLIATMADVVIRLTDGRSISDRVEKQTWNYYSFTNTYRETHDTKVVVSATSGDSAVFITLDGSAPTQDNYAYSTGSLGDGQDVIHIDNEDPSYAPCLIGDCNVYIGVYGFTDSEFNILLASSMTSIELGYGVPQLGSVRYNSYDHYHFPATGMVGTTDGVRISVNLYSGNSIVYVACNMEFPNATKFEVEMNPSVTNKLDLTLGSFAGCTGSSQISVAVKGITSATYSISVLHMHNGATSGDSNSLLLLPGVSAAGSVTYKKFNYYYIRIGKSSGDLNIIASVGSGDVDLYISASWEERPVLNKAGKVISYSVKSSAVGAEDVTIHHNMLAHMCLHKTYCYLIVGVYGNFYDGHDKNSVSEYTLMQSIGVTSITLATGVAQRGHVDARFAQYYMYTVTDITIDVVIAATTFYGDPDLYISTWPNTYPSGSNFTWMTAYWGDDTITLQASSLKEHCTASIRHNGNCELYIGVSSFTNTSYSILAYMDEGFKRPTVLFDGQAQSGTVAKGDYNYYSFQIALEDSAIAASVSFTMTPTSGGDADMYLVLRPDGGEPGRNNADYKTSQGPGQVDEIRLTPNSKYYCMHCTAYIAVFGFSASSYSIVASTDNMIGLVNGLSVGGSAEEDEYRYYSFYNPDPLGNVAITLTSESGDPDLYVTAYIPPKDGAGAVFTLPTTRSFTWRSLNTGGDDVTISYDMDQFCFECYYIVGVYASRANATFHVQATTKESPITTLYKNRPQTAVAHGMTTKHFRVTETTSTEDMSISMTSLGSGTVSMYFQAYNASTYSGQVPDPYIPSSYAIKTTNPDLYFDIDHDRFRRGYDDELIYVVSVKTFTDIRYTIMVTSTLSVVSLYDGQPQNQVVDKDSTALFKYYMAKPTDLQISLMSREGDPDLVVSMEHSKPSCQVNSHGNVLCGNFTWRSSSTSTDQIVISRDSPCAVVVPGTVVADNCKASSYGPGYIYIGVFGYEFSKFTLMVSPVGGHIQLLAGVPQLSVTSPGYVCASRSVMTGKCDTNRPMERVEAAYFSFRLNPTDAENPTKDQNTVIVSVLPFCEDDTFATTGECKPGCPCNPLQVYIRSCALSQCDEADAYPSDYDGQYYYSDAKVDSYVGSSIAVQPSRDNLACDPSVSGEPCVVNVLVMASISSDAKTFNSARFSITARSAGDVTLVSCADAKSAPDGNRDIQEQLVSGTHYFEVCNSGGAKEVTTVTVESCYKQTTLYSCTSHDAGCVSMLPSYESWGAYSTYEKTCTFDPTRNKKPVCETTEGYPQLKLQDTGNYYLLANGTSDFVMHVSHTMGGSDVSPTLNINGAKGYTSVPKISKKGDKAATVSWTQSAVTFPSVSSSKAFWSAFVRYSVYAVEAKLVNSVDKDVVHTTACGLKLATRVYPSYSRYHLVPALSLSSINRRELATYSVSGLKPGTKYIFMVQAICDEDCLREIQKTNPDAGDMCSGVASCQPQTLMYPPLQYTTSGTAPEDEVNWTHGAMKLISILGVMLVSLVGLATLGLGGWYLYEKHIGSGGHIRTGPSSSGSTLPTFSDVKDAASFVTDPFKRAAQSVFSSRGSPSSSSAAVGSSAPTPSPAKASIPMKNRSGYAPPSIGSSQSAATKSQYARLMSEDHDEDLDNAGL